MMESVLIQVVDFIVYRRWKPVLSSQIYAVLVTTYNNRIEVRPCDSFSSALKIPFKECANAHISHFTR